MISEVLKVHNQFLFFHYCAVRARSDVRLMRNSQSPRKNQKHILNRQIHESKAYSRRITGQGKNWCAKSLEEFVIVGSFRMLEIYFADVYIKFEVLFPNSFWLFPTFSFRRNRVGSQMDISNFPYLSQVQNIIWIWN